MEFGFKNATTLDFPGVSRGGSAVFGSTAFGKLHTIQDLAAKLVGSLSWAYVVLDPVGDPEKASSDDVLRKAKLTIRIVDGSILYCYTEIDAVAASLHQILGGTHDIFDVFEELTFPY